MFRLEETKNEIKEKYSSVEVKLVTFDFSSASPADYARLKGELSSLDIGVLYNNVGVSYEYAEYLQDVPEDKVTLYPIPPRSQSRAPCFP